MKNFKASLYVLGFITAVVALTGLLTNSLAYIRTEATLDGENTIHTKDCVSLKIEGSDKPIDLNGEFPIPNSEGEQKTPYSFKVTNTCSTTKTAKINLELLDGTTLSDSSLRVLLNKKGEMNATSKLLPEYVPATPLLTNAIRSYSLELVDIEPSETKEFDLRMWIDEEVTEEEINKIIEAKLVVSL